MNFKSSFQNLSKRSVWSFVLIFSLIFFNFYLLFFQKITLKSVSLILFFILFGALSRFPQKLAPISIGVEFVSLVTIVSAILYGSIVAVFVGSMAILISGFYTIERPQDIFIAVIGFILMALITPFFYTLTHSLGLTAIFLTLSYDLLTNIFYYFTGHSLIGCLRFTTVHVPSNYFILVYLGPILMGL